MLKQSPQFSQGNCTPNWNLACFVSYFKIVKEKSEKNREISIMKQIEKLGNGTKFLLAKRVWVIDQNNYFAWFDNFEIAHKTSLVYWASPISVRRGKVKEPSWFVLLFPDFFPLFPDFLPLFPWFLANFLLSRRALSPWPPVARGGR